MNRLLFASLALGLGACVTAGPGPDGGTPSVEAILPHGPECLPHYIRAGSILARDLEAAPISILCPTGVDEQGRAMTILLAGFKEGPVPAAFRPETGRHDVTRHLAYFPDTAAPLSAAVVHIEPRGERGTGLGHGQPDSMYRVPGFSAIEIVAVASETTVDGHSLAVMAAAFTLDGTPVRMVCVTAVDRATEASLASICRPQDTAGALVTANRIIAQDLPAVIFPAASGAP